MKNMQNHVLVDIPSSTMALEENDYVTCHISGICFRGTQVPGSSGKKGVRPYVSPKSALAAQPLAESLDDTRKKRHNDQMSIGAQASEI